MTVTVVVEDGTGIGAANSYLSVAGFKSYADQRGLSYAGQSDDQIGAALIRATAWIDATYRDRFPGVRSNGTSQGLLWPRKAGSIENGVFVQTGYLVTVTDAEGLPIAIDAVPGALRSATAEAAYREMVSPGSLAPDMERGGDIRRLQAGSVSIEYASTAKLGTTYSVIDGLMAAILTGRGAVNSPFTARAVRA